MHPPTWNKMAYRGSINFLFCGKLYLQDFVKAVFMFFYSLECSFWALSEPEGDEQSLIQVKVILLLLLKLSQQTYLT